MKNKKTFYDWCVDNNHEDWLQLWDYTLNTCTPKDISKAVNKKFYFKCPNGKHPSELKTICKLTRTDMDGRLFCKKCESFGQWCVDNNKIDLLKRWDCEKNKISPFFISKSSSSKKYYFKCPRGIHNSEGKRLNNIIRQQASERCIACCSFGQYCIDYIDKDFIEKYWSSKNTLDPFSIEHFSLKKVWIKCPNVKYHPDYQVSCHNFARGEKCPYCNSKKVHKLDSVGMKYPKIISKWSSKNSKSPFDFFPGSNKKIWFVCENNKHGEYYRSINNEIFSQLECPNCSKERLQSRLELKVSEYIRSLGYKLLHEYNCSFVARNPKTNYPLPFDNEIPELKLLIEVHGEQHYKKSSFYNRTEEDFNYLQWKDSIKKQQALSAGYNFIEIPYTAEKSDKYKEIIYNKIIELTGCKNSA